MTQKELNLKLRQWFDQNTVDTNKPSTAITRENFYHLYMYMTTYLNLTVFSPTVAKQIAFFVLAIPDSSLTNLLTQFDIHYKYLIQNRDHAFKAFKKSDLSKKDQYFLDGINLLYKESYYNTKSIIIYHNYSFIFNKTENRKLKTNDFDRLVAFAEKNSMASPIEVAITNDYFIITDHLKHFKIPVLNQPA